MTSFTMGYTSIAVIVGLSVIHIGIGLTAVVLGIVMSSQVNRYQPDNHITEDDTHWNGPYSRSFSI